MAVNKIVYGGNTLIDLTEDTVTTDNLLQGETAHDKSGNPITGNIPHVGTVDGVILSKDGVFTVQRGYHSGDGTVQIAEDERNKLVPENIKNNVTILGVTGKMTGDEDIQTKKRTVTPSTQAQTIRPAEEGCDYFSEITVEAIPLTYTENGNGQAVRIG